MECEFTFELDGVLGVLQLKFPFCLNNPLERSIPGAHLLVPEEDGDGGGVGHPAQEAGEGRPHAHHSVEPGRHRLGGHS